MYQSRWADPPTQAEQDGKDESTKPSQQPAAVTESNSSASVEPEHAATSALSAAAPTFAPIPSEPPPDISSAETFSSTAPQNDLFDEVKPFDEESMRIRSDDDLFNDDFTPAPMPLEEQIHAQPSPQTATRPPHQPNQPGRGDGVRARGRGRGRGPQGARGERQSAGRGGPRAPNGVDEPRTPADPQPPEGAPSGPRKDTVPSVRGERHGTGGIRKPKLTEDELAEKMAQIQIKNASLAAAHARAEADAASFAARETKAKVVADQRRKEERRDRQQMMGEREKNRQRKLKAMEGREWDAEKREDDFAHGTRFDKPANFAGDQQDYTDGREYLYKEPKNSSGGRGGGSGRGRDGRGGPPKAVPKQEDFPALPPASKANESAGSTDAAPLAGKSWAEQMESSTAA